jgi:hypothetical protein
MRPPEELLGQQIQDVIRETRRDKKNRYRQHNENNHAFPIGKNANCQMVTFP